MINIYQSLFIKVFKLDNRPELDDSLNTRLLKISQTFWASYYNWTILSVILFETFVTSQNIVFIKNNVNLLTGQNWTTP